MRKSAPIVRSHSFEIRADGSGIMERDEETAKQNDCWAILGVV